MYGSNFPRLELRLRVKDENHLKIERRIAELRPLGDEIKSVREAMQNKLNPEKLQLISAAFYASLLAELLRRLDSELVKLRDDIRPLLSDDPAEPERYFGFEL